jgi:penicillin-binding protein 1C
MQQVTGLTGAGPIWHAFMRTVLTGRPERVFQRPVGLVQVEVCALSGKLSAPDCPYRRQEWFIPGTVPTVHDDLYRRVTVDSLTGLPAGQATPPERLVQKLVLDLPLQAHAWARLQGLPLLADFCRTSCRSASPPLECSASCQLASSVPPEEPVPLPGEDAGGATASVDQGGVPAAVLILLSPDPNAVFHISTSRPLDIQKIHLEAAGPAGMRRVTLWVDGNLLADLARAPFEAWWQLQPGEHQAWAEAELADGEKLISELIEFTVK